LKLVNALFNGKHCLVNEQTVAGSGLDAGCHLASDAREFRQVISELHQLTFSANDIAVRHRLLDKMFDNQKNAKQIVEWVRD
ncbi:MAG TPA: mannosyltransferase, partial [Segetibacter sp.]